MYGPENWTPPENDKHRMLEQDIALLKVILLIFEPSAFEEQMAEFLFDRPLAQSSSKPHVLQPNSPFGIFLSNLIGTLWGLYRGENILHPGEGTKEGPLGTDVENLAIETGPMIGHIKIQVPTATTRRQFSTDWQACYHACAAVAPNRQMEGSEPCQIIT